MTRIVVSKLHAKGVISDKGMHLGRFSDIVFDEKDGRILSIAVRPISNDVLVGVPRDSSGNALIPFNAVISIRAEPDTSIVVNERVLAVHQLRAQPRGAAERGFLPSEE